MINNPASFTPDAIEAAKKVLELRESGDEDYQEPIKPVYVKTEKKSNRFLTKVNTSLLSIAVYQLLTGLFTIYLLSSFQFTNFLNILLQLIFIAIYSLNIVAAILLFKKKKAGIKLSIVLQYFHLFQVSLAGLRYFATPFFYLYIKFFFLGLGADFSLGSMSYSFNLDATESFLSINVISLIAIIILYKAKEKAKEKDFDKHLLEENQLSNNE